MTFTASAYYRPGHGETPVLLTTPEDIDTMIDDLLSDLEGDNSVASLHINERPLGNLDMPDHQLRIAVDAQREVGALRYVGDRQAWYVPGTTNPADEVEYFFTGHDEAWPQDSDTTIDTIRAAAKEFLASGGERPASADWAPWPADL